MTDLIRSRCRLVAMLVVMGALAASTAHGKGAGWLPEPLSKAVEASSQLIERIVPLVPDGARVDWSARRDRIAYDRPGADGYYDVWVMDPDGLHRERMTGPYTGVPQRHNGCPTWHPSGRYLAFVAEKADHPGPSTHYNTPGFGLQCDLWVMTQSGTRAWLLYETPTGLPAHSVLHPHFSPDGDKLMWAERVGPGEWGKHVIRVAEFVTRGPRPALGEIRTYTPGERDCWYETHCFTPDSKKIIFSGNLEQGLHAHHCDIYIMDLETGEWENLTNSPNDWDEHAQLAPDGETIVWMSSSPNGMTEAGEWVWTLRTDYWLMDIDGSDKRRLTFFNEPGAHEYTGWRVICADSAWSADGRRLAITLAWLGPAGTRGRGTGMIEFAPNALPGYHASGVGRLPPRPCRGAACCTPRSVRILRLPYDL